MKYLTAFLSIAIVFALSSCKTAQKYEANRLAGDAWLAKYTAPSNMSVAGNWESPEWGVATLHQNGKSVSGVIDRYDVKGVVSGTKLVLTISESGWIYYTAALDRSSSGELVGFYSYSVPFSQKDQRTMRLRRL